GLFAVLANHTYAEEGSYTLAVQLADVDGASLSGALSIHVADTPLVLGKLQNPHAKAGQDTGTFAVATFSDANSAALAADFTAVIQWGDGSTTTVTPADIVPQGGGTFAVQADHTYTAKGTYTLSVQVLDVGGASATGRTKITVLDG